MTEATTFKEAIDNKRFLEAEDMIKRGDDILKSQWAFKLSDAFGKIIQNNAFHVIEALVEHDHIELDIFEYDNFRDTIFLALTNSPDTDEAVMFFEAFIPKVENLNDSLEDDTWLSIALHYGMPLRLIQTMIENGCDINYIDTKEQNLLHYVVGSTYHKVTPKLRLEYIQLLIENGLDVGRPSIMGNTALHTAVSLKRQDVAKLLLEHGADANIPTKYNSSYPNQSGATPYHAAILDQFDYEMVELLSEYSPVDFYVETPRKTTLLFDYVESCRQQTVSERQKQFLQFFADNGADIMQISEDVYGRKKTVVDLLAEKSFGFFEAFTDIFTIDVNHTDDNGNTLLHKVCAYNVNYEERKAKDLYRKVKKLIKMGADVSLTNTQDKTAIDLASDDNLKQKAVALLLKQ